MPYTLVHEECLQAIIHPTPPLRDPKYFSWNDWILTSKEDVDLQMAMKQYTELHVHQISLKEQRVHIILKQPERGYKAFSLMEEKTDMIILWPNSNPLGLKWSTQHVGVRYISIPCTLVVYSVSDKICNESFKSYSFINIPHSMGKLTWAEFIFNLGNCFQQI
jgi:hypothetical protein